MLISFENGTNDSLKFVFLISLNLSNTELNIYFLSDEFDVIVICSSSQSGSVILYTSSNTVSGDMKRSESKDINTEL